MLNKDICIACVNLYCEKGLDDNTLKDLSKWTGDQGFVNLSGLRNAFLTKWNNDDERTWRFGEVRCRIVCPDSGCVQRAKSWDEPPSHCPYATEHIVSEGKKC
jgi:hypothetical protein